MRLKDCENRSSISGDIRTTTSTRNAISISRFSAETTGPIFTKILHGIVALVALFNLAHTRRYPIPFLNAKATKVGSLRWQRPLTYQKKVQIYHLHPKSFHSTYRLRNK